MEKKYFFYYLLSLFFLSFDSPLWAQTLSESTEYNISNTAITSGMNRNTQADVQNSTGKVVYVWNEYNATYGKEIFCSIYDADMNQLVVPFQINYNKDNDQIHAVVKVNQVDNSFVVAWASYHNGISDADVYVKKIPFDSDFTQVVNDSNEVRVNDLTSGLQYVPLLAFDYTRNELLVGIRDDFGYDGSGIGAYFRRLQYQSDSLTTSSLMGSQVLINQYTTNNQVPRCMEINPVTGELITVCQSYTAANSNYEVVRRVFIYDPVLNNWQGGAETVINEYHNQDQGPSSLEINENTGDYIIAWQSEAQDGSGLGAYAAIFDKDHNALKSEFRINSIATDNQLGPRVVWDNLSNIVAFFFLYSHFGLSTIQYRLYDATNNFQPYAAEAYALNPGPENTQNYYAAYLFPVLNQKNHKIYLPYDVFSNYTSNSIGKARMYQLEDPVFEQITIYAELKKELDGSCFYTIDKNLYFNYFEEYKAGALTYSICDYAKNILVNEAIAPLQKKVGLNKMEIDLSTYSLVSGNFYTLEVVSEKNEVLKLRFQYK